MGSQAASPGGAGERHAAHLEVAVSTAHLHLLAGELVRLFDVLLHKDNRRGALDHAQLVIEDRVVCKRQLRIGFPHIHPPGFGHWEGAPRHRHRRGARLHPSRGGRPDGDSRGVPGSGIGRRRGRAAPVGHIRRFAPRPRGALHSRVSGREVPGQGHHRHCHAAGRRLLGCGHPVAAGIRRRVAIPVDRRVDRRRRGVLPCCRRIHTRARSAAAGTGRIDPVAGAAAS
mmetsp:Transcript_28425/g.67670  ORF Transcript_28425/g.67670 Transcript_28425/m.67670 type:complete len:228 (-) Transcript_28425:113-796(-)